MGQVVTLSEITPEIVQLTLQDKEARNTFTPALIQGIIDAYEAIKANQTYKVVIMTGYDTYFCCGGTKVELEKMHRREDIEHFNFFFKPIDCEIPVISAMQGHAIGGGFAFACFADFMVLARESIYTTNFMKYGFTPGMGATYLVPLRLGHAIGNEMLYTAEIYRGGELQKRGIQQPVVPQAQVLEKAITLAKSLAEKPRASLVHLKNHLTIEVKEKLNVMLEREYAMQEQTFAQPEVADRLEALFGQ